MVAPTQPEAATEHARLEALRRYAILDTAPEREFDELVELAARECGYPTAIISFMDAARSWFKATTGFAVAGQTLRELPREKTFCNHALRSSGILVVCDAREDERFWGVPTINDADGYRAYMGAQLITPDGHSIGTLSMLDTTPRNPSSDQKIKLYAFATRVMALVESRRRDLTPAPQISTIFEPPAVAPDAPRNVVLIVDDEDSIREVISAIAGRLGWEIRLAADGCEALEKIAVLGDCPYVVITDIHMPGMNGFELAQTLSARPNPPPVIVMSGRLTPQLRADLGAVGVTLFIDKPFGFGAVRSALEQTVIAVRY